MTTSNRGVDFFYYQSAVPARAIALAKVTTTPETPAELTDVNNIVYASGNLTMTMYDSPNTVFTAPALEVPIAVTGDTFYTFQNQFFEVTDQLDANENPLYYQHPLPTGVTNVTILDLQGNIVPTGYVVRILTRGTAVNNYLLHSFPNVNNPVQQFIPYQVRYVDVQGYLHLEILKFYNVIGQNPFSSSAASYTASTILFGVYSTSVTYYIRWYAQNGYQILTPYDDIPNDPWFPRVRFSLQPTPPEYSTQVWTPQAPYQLATWTPGTYLSTHLIQFERCPIYFYNGQYPDILVYDSSYVLKYALAGKTGNGFLYPWQLNQFVDIDPNTGVLQVAVEIDPTDIIYGFYSYKESDVIFKSLDVNPYTNPAVRNRVIQFYQKTNGEDQIHYLYYAILNPDGSTYSTNDLSPSTGTNNNFGTILVGQSTSVSSFEFTDDRNRGGGLAPLYQTLPEAVNFWDIGYWDGKPFPSGGAMIIYLPVSIQNTFSTAEIQQIIGSVIPMGTIPVIFYYDNEGNETI